MLSKLPPRERQIVDILYERGPLLVSDICAALPDQLSGSAVRAMLKRLEDKGFVQRAELERGFLYAPTLSDRSPRNRPWVRSSGFSSTARPPVRLARCSECRTSSRKTSSANSNR